MHLAGAVCEESLCTSPQARSAQCSPHLRRAEARVAAQVRRGDADKVAGGQARHCAGGRIIQPAHSVAAA